MAFKLVDSLLAIFVLLLIDFQVLGSPVEFVDLGLKSIESLVFFEELHFEFFDLRELAIYLLLHVLDLLGRVLELILEKFLLDTFALYYILEFFLEIVGILVAHLVEVVLIFFFDDLYVLSFEIDLLIQLVVLELESVKLSLELLDLVFLDDNLFLVLLLKAVGFFDALVPERVQLLLLSLQLIAESVVLRDHKCQFIFEFQVILLENLDLRFVLFSITLDHRFVHGPVIELFYQALDHFVLFPEQISVQLRLSLDVASLLLHNRQLQSLFKIFFLGRENLYERLLLD